MTDRELVERALAARSGAYAPYSGFEVGAALLAADGTVYTGANIENASYGLSICAERVAVFKAVSEGRREFTALAVASGGDDYCRPCGACRQVLAEFAPDLRLLMANARGDFRETRLAELLPEAFRLRST
ncbi:MAG: cytidine deaminase [Thermoanaerobacterales bacterium]|nr:cytidine deaminase [Bacillota bacterium]MDI6905987.1 cytidine deaminase [Thermoanaerobacterales bacterium]